MGSSDSANVTRGTPLLSRCVSSDVLALARLPAADHLDDLHPIQLPIAHLAPSLVTEMVLNGAAGGLILPDDRPA